MALINILWLKFNLIRKIEKYRKKLHLFLNLKKKLLTKEPTPIKGDSVIVVAQTVKEYASVVVVIIYKKLTLYHKDPAVGGRN